MFTGNFLIAQENDLNIDRMFPKIKFHFIIDELIMILQRSMFIVHVSRVNLPPLCHHGDGSIDLV